MAPTGTCPCRLPNLNAIDSNVARHSIRFTRPTKEHPRAPLFMDVPPPGSKLPNRITLELDSHNQRWPKHTKSLEAIISRMGRSRERSCANGFVKDASNQTMVRISDCKPRTHRRPGIPLPLQGLKLGARRSTTAQDSSAAVTSLVWLRRS